MSRPFSTKRYTPVRVRIQAVVDDELTYELGSAVLTPDNTSSQIAALLRAAADEMERERHHPPTRVPNLAETPRGGRMTDPDPRQAAYDAVYQYLRSDPRPVGHNAHAWRCVHAALNGLGVGTPVDPQTGQSIEVPRD